MDLIIKSYHNMKGKRWEDLLAIFSPKVQEKYFSISFKCFYINYNYAYFWNVVSADERLQYKNMTKISILNENGIKKENELFEYVQEICSVICVMSLEVFTEKIMAALRALKFKKES